MANILFDFHPYSHDAPFTHSQIGGLLYITVVYVPRPVQQEARYPVCDQTPETLVHRRAHAA